MRLRLSPIPVAALASALLACACQGERLLRVTSDPSEAEVRLDGKLVGRTPCEIPLDHYGVRRVTLYLEGHRTYSRAIALEPPWYGAFPFDIVSEILIPWGWDDIHKVDVVLPAGQSVLSEPDFPEVLMRAENLRRAGPDGPQPLPEVEPERP